MGHYYDGNGRACHTVIGKNGNERATTLRDARERRLFKSVTTIMNVLDKPQLTQWKIREALTTAYEEHYDVNCEGTLEEYLSLMQAKTEERLRLKPDLGTAIHAAIEAFMNGESFSVEYEEYVYAARKALLNIGVPMDAWRSEHAYCWPRLGYAGTIDLHCSHLGRNIVLDFKSKGFAREKRGSVVQAKDVTWPEMVMQLAAYGQGLFDGQPFEAYNVMLSTEEPGLWLMRQWTQDEIAWGWKAFQAARDCCFIMDKYDPREV